MRVETEKMYLYPLSMEMHYLRLKRKLVYMLVVNICLMGKSIQEIVTIVRRDYYASQEHSK